MVFTISMISIKLEMLLHFKVSNVQHSKQQTKNYLTQIERNSAFAQETEIGGTPPKTVTAFTCSLYHRSWTCGVACVALSRIWIELSPDPCSLKIRRDWYLTFVTPVPLSVYCSLQSSLICLRRVACRKNIAGVIDPSDQVYNYFFTRINIRFKFNYKCYVVHKQKN